MSLALHPLSRSPRLPLRTTALGWWHGAVQFWQLRRADHALQGMSDAMLHDIGIARGEIADAIRHGRPGHA